MNHSSNALTMVSRMLVGELNRRVRTKPTKPVVLHRRGALRSHVLADNEGCVSLMRSCSG